VLANTVVAVGWGGTIVRTMALKRVPSDVADQVKLVFVAADPACDTAVALRRWLDSFDKRFVGLTGTEAALKAAQRATGVSLARAARSVPAAHDDARKDVQTGVMP